MKKTFPLLLLLMFCNGLFSQQSKPWTKTEITNLYKDLYLSSAIDSIPWNGNVQNCNSGSLPDIIYQKAENRINFFRVAAGLNMVKLNPKFNQEAQDAALLTKANNFLTHTANSSMKCYSASAAKGCSKSCLGFTDFKHFPSTSFITDFIQDYGESNYFVGHRRWLLYSKLASFGYGATNSTSALLTTDGVSYNDTTNKQTEFIAYPWSGYVPVNLIFPKWSFSLPDKLKADFENATITMIDFRGNEIRLVKEKVYNNFLDHTLVWTVKGLFSDNEIEYSLNNLEANGYLNKPIKVYIKNVTVDGIIKNYEYTVEPFKP